MNEIVLVAIVEPGATKLFLSGFPWIVPHGKNALIGPIKVGILILIGKLGGSAARTEATVFFTLIEEAPLHVVISVFVELVLQVPEPVELVFVDLIISTVGGCIMTDRSEKDGVVWIFSFSQLRH